MSLSNLLKNGVNHNIYAQMYLRKELGKPKREINECGSVRNIGSAIICVRKLRLISRSYLGTISLTNPRSLIRDFYALISWLLSENCDVAVVIWELKRL